MEIFVDSHGLVSWTDAAGALHKARCALGRSGIGDKISEGDGHTPVGRFALRRVMVRGDRVPDVHTALPVSRLSKTDGWCDDPTEPLYNRQISLPSPGSAESLWREDEIYDILVVIGFFHELKGGHAERMSLLRLFLLFRSKSGIRTNI